MLKTTIALTAAMILSTAFGAMAMTNGKVTAHQGVRAAASAPVSKNAVRAYTAEEAALFARASRPSYI